MGHYLNPGTDKFEMGQNSKIYVDKSGLIVKTNELIRTEERFVCISRPRRFGKTMGANMLAAYYGISENAHEWFKDLEIARHETYEKHLNKYNVLMINMQVFLSQTSSMIEMLALLQSTIMNELINENPDVVYQDQKNFIHVMKDIYAQTKIPFVILIDEWDCTLREQKNNTEDHRLYLDFLRLWLKDQIYVGLAYMTGILPIKKYGSHSALNMFDEYSMIDPSKFINYFGFTASEVRELAKEYDVDFEEIQNWYNGYFVDSGNPLYSPKSVNSCLIRKRFSNYWNKTETFEALRDYIMLDFDGLKAKVTEMIAGEHVEVTTDSFTNDMTTFNSADDVLTLLVHLGYLTYNFDEKTVRIPNEEVKGEFVTSVKTLKWNHIVDSIRESGKLLEAIWKGESDVVADGVAKVHEENTSILAYNDENALSCVLSLALFSAKDYYTIVREMPAGKGYADLIFVPHRKEFDKPALVIELKWDKTIEGAISQIKERNYLSVLGEYDGNVLLVGINYDKETKVHECVIESWKS